MLVTNFSSKNLELLLEISRKQKTTAREQSTYSPFAFYMNIGMLRRYGLVCEDGIEGNGRKMWKLTKDGVMFLDYMNKVEEVLKHGKSRFSSSEGK